MRSNDGSLRGIVGKVDFNTLPEQSAENDKKMFIQQDNLYGNTRLTDEQFAYSYRKCGGNITHMMKKDLTWMSVQALRNRADELGLPQMGPAGTSVVDVEKKVKVFESIVERGDTYAIVAKRLNITSAKVKAICERLDVKPYGAIGMSDKIFKNLFKNCSRNKQRMSDMTGLQWFTIDRKCRVLGV